MKIVITVAQRCAECLKMRAVLLHPALSVLLVSRLSILFLSISTSVSHSSCAIFFQRSCFLEKIDIRVILENGESTGFYARSKCISEIRCGERKAGETLWSKKTQQISWSARRSYGCMSLD